MGELIDENRTSGIDAELVAWVHDESMRTRKGFEDVGNRLKSAEKAGERSASESNERRKYGADQTGAPTRRRCRGRHGSLNCSTAPATLHDQIGHRPSAADVVALCASEQLLST